MITAALALLGAGIAAVAIELNITGVLLLIGSVAALGLHSNLEEEAE